MASSSAAESCVFEVFSVRVEGNGFKFIDCTVRLYKSKIEVIQNDELKITIPMTNMKSIQVHQPIFGANYISVEYLESEGKSSMQMIFTRGGAIEFSRAFFRVTEGELVSTETAPIREPVESHESKKNV